MIKISMPPLNIAAEKGDLENVKALLNSKVDVDSLAQSTGETPLHHAAGKGHKKISELLIVNGADVNGSGTMETLRYMRQQIKVQCGHELLIVVRCECVR